MLGWVFLAASIWGALFTSNALRPLRGPWPIVGIAFFPAWLTTELALHHLLWQGVATAVFIAWGALEDVPGQVGLVITLASWVGLAWLLANAHRDGDVVHQALEDVLGPEFRDTLDAEYARHLRTEIEWRKVLVPFWIGHRAVERIRDLKYVDDDNPRHRLDVYRRPDVVPHAPVLLQIHGGAWMIGSKEQQGLPLMYHMAARGWVCVSINYSLSPSATWPEHLIDCKLALKWIREQITTFGGDPNVIVVTGGSAGGHLAAMIALTPNDAELQPGFEDVDTRVQGFVPFYGVFDWTDRLGLRGERCAMQVRLEHHIVKHRRHARPDVYHHASPMTHVGGEVPPAMILHGANDTIAPVAEAKHFVELLREHSSEPVVYVEFAGAHHAFEVFPSIRALHAINGVEAFAAWIVSREYRRRDAEKNRREGAGPVQTLRVLSDRSGRTLPLEVDGGVGEV